MTERELFESWLAREGVEFSVEDDGADIVVRSTYTEARISFREDGTFEGVSSGE